METNKLHVYLENSHVGVLTKTRAGARFSYDKETPPNLLGRPLLSCALPVKARPYGEGLTGAWFSGLLPEGERLARLAKELKVDSYDYFNLLKEVGWECAGAVVITPAASLSDIACGGGVPLNNDELALRLCQIVADGGASEVDRVSLGGFQDKLCLSTSKISAKNGRLTSANWMLPSLSQISTHILKPQPKTAYPGIIEGEAWAMQVARLAARVANTWLLGLSDAPQTLVVERFDRKRTAEGGLERVHQEDCAQALGLSPSEKYASVRALRGNDPSYAKIAEILVKYADEPILELEELVRQIVVNVCVGNTDAHAKNTSFVYKQACVPSLAPMYDVVPVCDIEPQAKYFSLRVNGKAEISAITKLDVVKEAQSWGLDTCVAEAVVDSTVSNICEGVESADALYPSAAARHSESTKTRIERFV